MYHSLLDNNINAEKQLKNKHVDMYTGKGGNFWHIPEEKKNSE